jgi:hypothetical protein
MKHKYGGLVGAVTNPTQSNASGIWSHEEYIDANSKNLWPIPHNIVRRSLRFNSADSASFGRTPTSASNRQTFTFSAWTKLGKIPFSQNGYYISARTSSSDNFGLTLTTGNAFQIDGAVGGTGFQLTTTSLYRDPSAWYHIVMAIDTTQSTSANRIKFYVNGVEITSFSTASYMAQNSTLAINNTIVHNISGYAVPVFASNYIDGYLAEVNFVDGQALTPTSFGEFDPQSGIWVPKVYTGTYGTNGYRLNFSDNSSTAALGLDYSGNGNNWTPANFSVTSGVNNDSYPDSPSFFNTDFGSGGEVIGNYATLNPIDAGSGSTLSKGNLRFTQVSAYTALKSSIPFESGKCYFEVTFNTPSSAGGQTYWCWGGIAPLNDSGLSSATNIQVYATTNTGPGIYKNGSLIHSITGWATGQTLSWAFDVDNLTLDIYRNGVQIGSRITVSAPPAGKKYAVWYDTYFNGMVLDFNFGQRQWTYPPPSGFKSLCSTNLPTPSIGLSVDNRADDHFNTVLYTGNGSTQSITNVGFAPDFVWIKRRDSNWSHCLYDVIRGAGSLKALAANANDAEGVFNADTTYGYLSSFNSNGFSVVNGSIGGYTNLNNATYVAWCWKGGGSPVSNTQGSITSSVSASQPAGFSVLTYTGTGAAATIGHGLGATPEFVIVKCRSAGSTYWDCFHTSVGPTKVVWLNYTDAPYTDSTVWNNASPTSTVFTVGTHSMVNGSGASYVAYCWRSVPGFSLINSYTGNGNADGTFIYTGFRPTFVLIKPNLNLGWQLFDSKRNAFNPTKTTIQTNLTNAESDWTTGVDLLSNGFKVRQSESELNQSSIAYYYIAFAESPFRLALAR